MTSYAELHITSNFSFLEGASHADELAIAAAALGLQAIALTDRNSLAGVVRGHLAAKQAGIRYVDGARLDLVQDVAAYEAKPLGPDQRPRAPDGFSLLAYPSDRAAYSRLSRLISRGRQRAPKGACWLSIDDVLEYAEGLVFALLPDTIPPQQDADALAHRLQGDLRGALYLATHPRFDGADGLARDADLARRHRLPLLATNAPLMHTSARKPLADVLACIRHRTTIDQAGFRLAAHAERHLKAPAEMARLFREHPQALANTLEIPARCPFSLDELRYEYPAEILVDGETAQQSLTRLTREGAAHRYPQGVPPAVEAAIVKELGLIDELNYAPYFLTVYDIVRFARSQDILCQGRGSAANSAVCYCLGITAVDPTRIDLLFERFVSAARDEPPDIDVDFEHERREEVIQYLYTRYGRHRAGLTATVVTYRARGAIREVGKALGLSADTVGAISGNLWGWYEADVIAERVAEAGLDPADRRIALAITLARELIGFPRHLSQHTGGFVIARDSLEDLVPIENAAMAERTVIEWDKDDIDALGILKVDVLGLGMLTCVRKAFDLLRQDYGRDLGLATIPAEDPAVYDMLCAADAIGVFQVESRAQMSMLARLKPRNFYDLVIEVAIVRPGPIQGDMVHPYLRRRSGLEPVTYPSPELERVLAKTCGVPLFQEQAMRIAIVAAGFTPSEADRLRRAMATFRRVGTIHTFQEKMIEGMTRNGYDRAFAERCFRQIEGFGEYGFPESHAASFALLVYASAWLKRHHPEIFAAAILNSQPMGFYAPSQLVRDAADHGVEVRPVDVNHSGWDCTLEERGDELALRLGFRLVKGAREQEMAHLVALRTTPYNSIAELQRRTGLPPASLERLAADRYSPCADLLTLPSGGRTCTAGLVLVRQRPGTASGVIFATLEDETGIANIIVWPKVFEAHRKALLGSRLLGVEGMLQREDTVTHLIAHRLVDLSHHLATLGELDGDSDAFARSLARADEVRRPGADPRQKQVTAAKAVMPKGRNFR